MEDRDCFSEGQRKKEEKKIISKAWLYIYTFEYFIIGSMEKCTRETTVIIKKETQAEIVYFFLFDSRTVRKIWLKQRDS